MKLRHADLHKANVFHAFCQSHRKTHLFPVRGCFSPWLDQPRCVSDFDVIFVSLHLHPYLNPGRREDRPRQVSDRGHFRMTSGREGNRVLRSSGIDRKNEVRPTWQRPFTMDRKEDTTVHRCAVSAPCGDLFTHIIAEFTGMLVAPFGFHEGKMVHGRVKFVIDHAQLCRCPQSCTSDTQRPSSSQSSGSCVR